MGERDGTTSERVVLTIERWSSRCGACGHRADPFEAQHTMTQMRGEGCGATFTHVQSPYPTDQEAVEAMRPDLVPLPLIIHGASDG